MTDKELLELAAKAAGITDGRWMGDGNYFVGSYECGRDWNPLTDDGDALRLLVSCRLETTWLSQWGRRSISAIRTRDIHGDWNHIDVDYTDSLDPYAATRRAIVRAAAEIGKGMK
jgi:ABC-type transporter lipoprotein component MlaA